MIPTATDTTRMDRGNEHLSYKSALHTPLQRLLNFKGDGDEGNEDFYRKVWTEPLRSDACHCLL